MKKSIYALAAALALPAAANADITLSFDSNPGGLTVIEIPFSTGDENSSELKVGDNLKAVYKVASGEPARVVFLKPGERRPVAEVFVAGPSDNLNVVIDGDGTTYSGTGLMEGISRLQTQLKGFNARFSKIMKGESSEDPDAVEAEYYAAIKNFMAADPRGAAVPYALLMLDGEDFMKGYDNLDPALRSSILMPLVEEAKADAEKQIKIQQLYRQLESGVAPAPAFSLPDPDGKMVSLADFRGKWVILDFWGSWCGWCIKGIPELKDAYGKYKDRLEVVGIDCRDDREDWIEAIKKYELPWVHVYNDTDNVDTPDRVDRAYGVQGFPTKIIIDPEGYVKKIVVGEDPSFYTILAGYLK